MTGRPKISQKTRRAVYERDRWTCQYCGRVFQPSEGNYAPHEVDRIGPNVLAWNDVWLELDHIHPRHHGGQDDIGNLRACCTPCNRRKSFKLMETAHA